MVIISFHKFSYKSCCFKELVFNSSVLLLMICSFKDVLKDFALYFVLLVLGLLLVYIADPWQFAMFDLLFVNKVLTVSYNLIFVALVRRLKTWFLCDCKTKDRIQFWIAIFINKWAHYFANTLEC